MATVLVIEDEPSARAVLELSLRQAGHEVVSAPAAKEGVEEALRVIPDLVLLDLMLPDGRGTDVLRKLSAHPTTSHVPVIVVTARDDEIDRVLSFELGAQDYVTKPFSMRELLLRIQVILRARSHYPLVVRFGRLTIDRAAGRVFVDDREVRLTKIELKLLTLLHERRDRFHTRASLLKELRGLEDMTTPTRAVDAHVKRLREKLGAARDYVITVRGNGYRFADEPSDPVDGRPLEDRDIP